MATWLPAASGRVCVQKIEGCDEALIGYADDPLTDQLRPTYDRNLLLACLRRIRLAELLTDDVPQDFMAKRGEADAWAQERVLEAITQFVGPGMPLVVHSSASPTLFDTIVARSTHGDSHAAAPPAPTRGASAAQYPPGTGIHRRRRDAGAVVPDDTGQGGAPEPV